MENNHLHKLTLCSFNCRGVKSSIDEVRQLCHTGDIIFLQEHWLLPEELTLLSDAHPDFLAVSNSAVDTTAGLLIGRPYGGTGILYKKSLTPCIQIPDTKDSRVTAIILHTIHGPVLFICVYMPVDYGHSECYENYIETCANIKSLFENCEAVQVVIAGDFNCSAGTRFYGILTDFAVENNLVFTDLARLSDVFTYCNDAGTKCSWIDHVLCSQTLDDLIDSCYVNYDFVTSDHKPIITVFTGLLPDCNIPADDHPMTNRIVHDWSRADDYCIANYQYQLDLALRKVNIPVIDPGSDLSHTVIDNYYDTVISCIQDVCSKTIPCKTQSSCFDEYVVPGWNDYVQDKHTAARNAFQDWMLCGKPRSGPSFETMKQTRAHFKLSLRYCKQHADMLRADSYASCLSSLDYNKFWDNIRKTNNNKVKKYTDVIDGCIGENAIVGRWRMHFEQLYNQISDDNSKHIFYNRLSEGLKNCDKIDITVGKVATAIDSLKAGKAAGPDCIASEALKYACPRLSVHLCYLFNLFLKCGYMPANLMQSIIIPLLKNKCGNLSDINNYRAIAISTSISKVFESVLLESLVTWSDADQFQFGFKPGHSTGICTSLFKQTVDYYRSRGSHVFACFIDFSKAFDNVNYWRLFNNLLDDNVNYTIVRILAYWYSNQECFVRWRNSISVGFRLSNGTRQGGVLSPFLFSRYIRDLIYETAYSGFGCKIANHSLNILAYADDIVLLAPSWKALQNLLSILYAHAVYINMSINIQKTVAMVFAPKRRSMIVATEFPMLQIGLSYIKYVQQFKYLGHIITNGLTDDEDIGREIKNMFARTNILMRKFSKCSSSVKKVLFKSFCLCFYDIALWKYYNISSMTRFRYCYNRCMKLFFGYSRYYSVTSMLLDLNLPSFDTIMHNSILQFMDSLNRCNNNLVKLYRALS